jgi:hypothetical protein
MKTAQIFTKIFAFAGLFSLSLLIGCNKSVDQKAPDAAETESLTMASTEDAIADIIFSDIHEQELGLLDDIGLPDIGLLNESEIGLDSAGRCVKVTIVPRDPLVFPKTVTFDYGTGCPGRDGKARKGKMITVYSAPMFKPGATAVTRFENFYVNGVKVEGVHSTKNNSTAAYLIFTRRVEKGKLTFPNGGVSIWNASHTNKQVAGLGTPGFPRDDEFEITGSAKGVFEKGTDRLEWSRAIVEPLHKANSCRWIAKGVVHITRNDKKAILNYGDGTCDNKAVIIINGERKEITL